MYAVVEDGARQFKVKSGDVLWVDFQDAKPGAKYVFDKVLLSGGDGQVKIGRPYISGAKVIGEVLSQAKAPKLISHDYRRRENYHRRIGHRQPHLVVKITEIKA